jgi:hypothetical protein
MHTVDFIKKLVVVSLISVLVACGGGGDESYVEIPGGGTDLDVTAPRIISQSPSVDSSASIDVVVSLGFDEEIDSSSIAEDAIQINGPDGAVAGTVSYDPDLIQVSFVSDDYLVAFSTYQVEFTGITDIHGNLVEQNQNWSFTTIFDQLPPELPEF